MADAPVWALRQVTKQGPASNVIGTTAPSASTATALSDVAKSTDLSLPSAAEPSAVMTYTPGTGISFSLSYTAMTSAPPLLRRQRPTASTIDPSFLTLLPEPSASGVTDPCLPPTLLVKPTATDVKHTTAEYERRFFETLTQPLRNSLGPISETSVGKLVMNAVVGPREGLSLSSPSSTSLPGSSHITPTLTGGELSTPFYPADANLPSSIHFLPNGLATPSSVASSIPSTRATPNGPQFGSPAILPSPVEVLQPPMGAAGPSQVGGKRKRSDDSQHPKDTEKRRKRKPDPEEGQWYCLICRMFGRGNEKPLSRRDVLKRHIASLHQLYKAVLDHNEFDIFKLRHRHEIDGSDIVPTPLIQFCIRLQMELRSRGEQIESEDDLATKYPIIAASTNRS
ncbi:hypothetical protein JVU11DRAFT_5976 [Chiua virens]|nr:hypothetical protein JVU11DRAFT_5976 [Chiua virens]